MEALDLAGYLHCPPLCTVVKDQTSSGDQPGDIFIVPQLSMESNIITDREKGL